jgi:hypothetical protein
MPYPTQHENFYKNQVIQLQQELQQLTETYQYKLKLNEGIAGLLARYAAREVAETAAQRAAREAVERAAREAAEAAARAAREALAARVEAFSRMSPAEIIRAISTGGNEFAMYVAQNYGRIVQVGSSYQRLLPNGTVQGYGANGQWVIIDKAGFMTAFGPISSNGIAIPMDVYRQMGHGGISPGDIIYTPYRPTSFIGTTPQRSIIPYQGSDPNVVPPM